MTEVNALKELVRTLANKFGELHRDVILIQDWIEKITTSDDFISTLPEKTIYKQKIRVNKEAKDYDKQVQQMDALHDLEDLGIPLGMRDEEDLLKETEPLIETTSDGDFEFDINDVMGDKE